jgi:hypothetical protein
MKISQTWAAAGLAAALLLRPAVAGADVVLDWNAITVATVAGQNPFVESRIAAITHLAVFEAVNAVTGRYRPYLGTITAPPGASPEAAAITAAHGALIHYLPAAAANLDAARAASLAAIPDGQAKEDGIALGEAAAAAMINERANDGSSPPLFYLPTSTARGDWQLTPSCPPQGGVLFHVRDVTPLGIRSGDQFRADPPPSLRSREYTRAYREVKRVGAANSTHRPPDRANVARFYAAVNPVGTWNPAVRQVSVARGLSLTANARAFALVNMALVDASVAVFDTKYFEPFWRPETAIRAGDADGNPFTDGDPGFLPFLTVPCHPSYPSGHGTLSNAARTVAERLFGSHGHSITLSTPAVPGVVLQYRSFKAIADDIADARVFGGIHFRFDQEAGARQGRRVGAYVHRHNLRRAHGHGVEDDGDPIP